MSGTLHARARAKVNLSLHITGKRADGYHLLDSLVAFADVADEVEVSAADELSLIVEGEFAIDCRPGEGGGGEQNLVMRAALLLQKETGCTRGAAIRLKKHLPVGGGLGGGSADAAASLRLLNQLWALELNEASLAELGLQLGADVPMCIAGIAARVNGIGEVLTPVKLPKLHAVLVHPRVPLLTKDVYGALLERTQAPTQYVDYSSAAELLPWLQTATNDLQKAAVKLQPLVGDVLNAIAHTQPLLARMSGSGACCFGLYDTAEDAARAAKAVGKTQPKWWVAATELH